MRPKAFRILPFLARPLREPRDEDRGPVLGQERQSGKRDGGRMLSTRVGVLSGLRGGIFSLIAVMSFLAVSSETSDARARRKHVAPSETSSNSSEAVSQE